MQVTENQFKNYRFYDLIMACFVTLILCSNLVGASKVCRIAGFSFSGTILFFPISYLFGDILTEVYGYKRSRKVVWAGFGSMIFASFVSWVVISLPPASEWKHQLALETVFAQTPRIVIASLTAYFFGEFSNSFVMAKMKILTRGKKLWSRIIGSTIIGEGVDSIIFYPLAFMGTWPNSLLLQVMISNYAFKIVWETLMIPFTYKIVNFLKKVENEDYYDFDTQFTPFSLDTE